MNRPGYALIGALWLMVAIAVAGLQLALAAKPRRLAAMNAVEGKAATYATRGALEQLIAGLDARIAEANLSSGPLSPAYDPWQNAQALVSDMIRIGDLRVLANITDTGALLNVNLATFEELSRFFGALGADAALADRLAARAIDWRDADAHPVAGGAERQQYLDAGALALPADAPFDRVSELRSLLGMPPELYAAALPHITTDGDGRINLNSAASPVLLALEGMSPEAAEVLGVRRAEGGRVLSLLEIAMLLPLAPRLHLEANAPALSARSRFTVDAVVTELSAWLPRSPVVVRLDAVIQRTPDGARVQEVAWR